jgi:hypothetical protein
MKRIYSVVCFASLLGACGVEEFDEVDDESVGVEDDESVGVEDEATKPTIEVVDDGQKSTAVNISWECNVSGNNSGCFGDVICPDNKFVKAVKAGCNLEVNSQPPSWAQVSSLPSNIVNVFRVSDVISQGVCKVGQTSISQNSWNVGVSGFARAIHVGCKEHDQNGGDCLQRGYVTCDW